MTSGLKYITLSSNIEIIIIKSRAKANTNFISASNIAIFMAESRIAGENTYITNAGLPAQSLLIEA